MRYCLDSTPQSLIRTNQEFFFRKRTRTRTMAITSNNSLQLDETHVNIKLTPSWNEPCLSHVLASGSSRAMFVVKSL